MEYAELTFPYCEQYELDQNRLVHPRLAQSWPLAGYCKTSNVHSAGGEVSCIPNLPKWTWDVLQYSRRPTNFYTM